MLPDAGVYFSDAYARACDARVVQVEEDWVALDRTVFCPGEGGQAPDRGWLRWESASAGVTGVQAERGQFWHRITGETPPVGAHITSELDWPHRLRMMRTHTAYHLVSALALYVSGARVARVTPLATGLRFHMMADLWHPTIVADIERRANEAIAANLPVLTYTLSRAEALATPLIHPMKIAMMPDRIACVRVVEIEGITLDIDTGTHVRALGEIGALRLNLTPGSAPVMDLHLITKRKIATPQLATVNHAIEPSYHPA